MNPTTHIWHPVDGKPVNVELHKQLGLANLRRCVVDGKTIGYVWQRSISSFCLVWSYRFESDTLGIIRGSCRDRAEAVGRLMFDARVRGLLVAAAAAAAATAADEATK